ncbi:MAG: GNAT family N-acetyltransferase [Rhodospirillales bacterium 20-64-7]|nr:MAG: GNAT family N-acetyltransferase [Rhodospirillales bacterium 20-64-7]HQT78110.1 GNAT family N-acetyltransferase [Rhodopila sp.]
MGPVTRVGVTVTFLRMDHAPRTPPPALPPGMQVIRAQAATVPFYRYLYNTVGADYLWWLRRTTPDAELAALLGDRAIGIYTLYNKGEPGGFFELDSRTWPDVNLSYFGLMPFMIGTGVGHAFLRCAVDEAWRLGAKGMTVNTCTADHPRALPNYLRAGFHVVRKVREVWSIPDSLHLRIPETLRL